MPDTVRLVKKIWYKIEEKADAAINVVVDDVELGIDEDDGSATAPHAAPATRAFVSPRTHNNATGNLVAVMMASMLERQQPIEEEREERRAQQQQHQMMMAAMMATFMGGNSASRNATAPIPAPDDADEDATGRRHGRPKDDRDYE